MKLSSMFTGLVAGFAAVTTVVSSPVSFEKRAAQDVIGAIDVLTEELIGLNNTASGYVGGIAGLVKAIRIQIESGKVQSAIESARDTVVDSTEEIFNFADSQGISVAMVSLRPKILQTLQTMISKEPEFAKGVFGLGVIPLNGIVLSSLEKQYAASKEFADVLVPMLDPVFANIAPLLIESINKAFDEAIAVFS